MKKLSKHYPSQFAGIAAKTIRCECWTFGRDTPGEANSLKTQWYNYTAALKSEGDLAAWALAIRVTVSVSGTEVTFQDRDKSKLARDLDGMLAEEPVDQAGLDFAKMMKGK